MAVNVKYEKIIEAEGGYAYTLALIEAAKEHGYKVGANMHALEGALLPGEGGGRHSITLSADSPEELAEELANQAIAVGKQFGYEVEFTDDPPRREEAPASYPQITYHLHVPETGERVDSVTVDQSEAKYGLHDRVKAHLEATRPQAAPDARTMPAEAVLKP